MKKERKRETSGEVFKCSSLFVSVFFFFLIVSGAKLVAAEMSVPSNEAHKGRNVKKKKKRELHIYFSNHPVSQLCLDQ